jgi:hypothetical protein
MNKRLLAIGLIIVCCVHQANGQSWLRTFKKNVLDFNPVSTFWQVSPQATWLDKENTLKNNILRIGALSFERSLCPSVGVVAKRYITDVSARGLGEDKEFVHYGPLVIDGKTLSYYMVNFIYGVTFADGDLGQRVSYTLYKMCIRKECSRFVFKQITRVISYLRINKVLDYCLCGFINKKPYRVILTDVAKRAVTSAIDEIIHESFGKPYVLPLINVSAPRTE